MTLLSLWTDVRRTSPCLTTASYRAFLASGRFVSTTPFTRSIEQFNRPAAMKRDRSLETPVSVIFSGRGGGRGGARVDKGLGDAKGAGEVGEGDASVRLEELGVGLDAHLADVVAGVDGEEAGGDEVLLFDFGWRVGAGG